MTVWRVIADAPRGGAANMARDEAILDAVQDGRAPPTLRFFRWSPRCLSLGAFQRASDEVDESVCDREGVEIVRRPTGGRAILHHCELTYSLSAPVSVLGSGPSVLASYQRISTALIAGLRTLGVPAILAPRRSDPIRLPEHSPACFDAPSDYEILVGERKLIGSAQMRRGNHLLQHGSLLIRFAPDPLLALLRLDVVARRRWREQMQAGVTDLEREVGSIDLAALRGALIEGFARIFRTRFEPGALSPAEEQRAGQLEAEKYATRAWTFRR